MILISSSRKLSEISGNSLSVISGREVKWSRFVAGMQMKNVIIFRYARDVTIGAGILKKASGRSDFYEKKSTVYCSAMCIDIRADTR